MRLKAIKLSGFKSFVDSTTVPFATNMTAIVGPNGCGKSNTIDAVRWVMGESSAKQLRGENMTDVIFNGSTGRKPVSLCSVELLFDNSDFALRGEFSGYSEVSVKRKVSRDGQNHYFLNNQKCRRKDVTDLFMGTGLGPRSYAIIEQGMISKLIESKPDELRVFIEEAAGISRYKSRRKDTENRIKRTRENLERLLDIRLELGKQMDKLDKQAKACERFKELKTEERLLKAQIQAQQWLDLQHQLLNVEQKHSQNELDKARLMADGSLINASLIELNEQHFSLIELVETQQQAFYQLGTQVARLEKEFEYESQLQFSSDQKLKELCDELNELELRQQALLQQISPIDADLAMEQEQEGEIAQMRLLELEEVISHLEAEQQAWQSKWDQAQRQFHQSHQRLTQLHQQKQHLLLQQQKDQQQLMQLNEQLKQWQIAEPLTDDEQQELALAEQQKELHLQNQTSLTLEQSHCQQSHSQLSRTISDLQQTHIAAQKSLAVCEALLVTRDEPLQREWLAQQGLHNAQSLIEVIQVQPQWQHAVNGVLAQWLNAYISDQPLADFDFARMTPQIELVYFQTGNSPKPSANRQSEFATLADQVQSPINLDFVLANIRCVTADEIVDLRDSLSEEQSLITQDGLWCGKTWFKQLSNAQSRLQLSAQREQLIQQLTAIETDVDTQQRLLDENRQQLAQIEAQLAAEKQHLIELELNIVQLRQQNQHKLSQHQQALKQQHYISEQIGQLNQQGELAEAELEEIELRLLAQEESDLSEHDDSDALQAKAEQLRLTLVESRAQQQQQQQWLHQWQMTQQTQRHQQALLAQQQDQLRIAIHKVSEQIRNHKSVKVDQQLIENLQAQLTAQHELQFTAQHELTTSRQQLADMDGQIQQYKRQQSEIDEQLIALRLALEEGKLQRHSLDSQMQQLSALVAEEGFDIQRLSQQLNETTSHVDFAEKLVVVRDAIVRLGNINLAAVDELAACIERKGYLDRQNEELEKAIATLEGAIKKIDRETKARFAQTFDFINAGLAELFPKVFGGGSAWLELTSDDWLETGIRIMARPPGKKNSTIHLLSGGEKALTAIALVFAIFRLNPAPFCMLDEVDAPLDDANVLRYANLVQAMSEHVQFIYITHNKIAMEKATDLMGVTMNEPGVSKLVSVSLKEAQELVEEA